MSCSSDASRDEDWSVSPSSSEEESTVVSHRQRSMPKRVRVAPSDVFYRAPPDDPAALACASIADVPPNAIGLDAGVVPAKGDRLAIVQAPLACGTVDAANGRVRVFPRRSR